MYLDFLITPFSVSFVIFLNKKVSFLDENFIFIALIS